MHSTTYLSIIDDEPKDIDLLRRASIMVENVILTYTDSNIDNFLKNVHNIQYPHFLFLDIYLEDDNGISKIPEILNKFPNIEIILYSVSENPHDLMHGIKSGASGYLIKDNDVNTLSKSLEVIKSGGAILSAKMAKFLIQNTKPIEKITQGRKKLTHKDMSLINNLAKGYSYVRIAELEGISINTLQGRIKSLYRKLNVSSKIQAINLMTKSK